MSNNVASLVLILILSSVIGIGQQQTPVANNGSLTEQTLTAQEQLLVNSSREAILKTGISDSYFDTHFKLLKVVNAAADRRVIWKFSVNEYETFIQDSIGSTSVGKGSRTIHSVSSTLGSIPEIRHTIKRARAERLLRTCIGRFEDPTVELRPAGDTGKVTLFLAATAIPKNEKLDTTSHQSQSPTSQAPPQSQTIVNPHPAPVSDVENFKPKPKPRRLLVLGAVDLQTGKCVKGVGQVGPPRTKNSSGSNR